MQILKIFPLKMLILTNFPKNEILNNFPLLKVKNMGKFFHNFFTGWEKVNFVAEYSPMRLHKEVTKRSSYMPGLQFPYLHP